MAKEDIDSTEEVEEVEDTEEVESESSDESEDQVDDQDETEDKEETTVEDDETDDPDDSDEDEEEDDDSDTFEKRFTQIKGETLPDYAKNLEEAYAQSTTEALRLNKQLAEYKQKVDSITKAVGEDPELAEKLNVAQSSPDPALNHAREVYEKQMRTEYDSFLKDHPEIETDPTLGEKLTKRLTTISKAIQEDEGRTVGMGEGLELAWASLGLGDDNKEIIQMATKAIAGKGKTTSSKKVAPKSQLTPAQLDVANKFGLNPEQLKEFATTKS